MECLYGVFVWRVCMVCLYGEHVCLDMSICLCPQKGTLAFFHLTVCHV